MFEIIPIKLAIGRGWFQDTLGFCLEFELLTMLLESRTPKIYLHGSLFAFYIEIWREEDGCLGKDVSWDFLYLKQVFDKFRKKKN